MPVNRAANNTTRETNGQRNGRHCCNDNNEHANQPNRCPTDTARRPTSLLSAHWPSVASNFLHATPVRLRSSFARARARWHWIEQWHCNLVHSDDNDNGSDNDNINNNNAPDQCCWVLLDSQVRVARFIPVHWKCNSNATRLGRQLKRPKRLNRHYCCSNNSLLSVASSLYRSASSLSSNVRLALARAAKLCRSLRARVHIVPSAATQPSRPGRVANLLRQLNQVGLKRPNFCNLIAIMQSRNADE